MVHLWRRSKEETEPAKVAPGVATLAFRVAESGSHPLRSADSPDRDGTSLRCWYR